MSDETHGSLPLVTVKMPCHGHTWVNGERIQNISRHRVGVDRIETKSETWLWYWTETPSRAVFVGVGADVMSP